MTHRIVIKQIGAKFRDGDSVHVHAFVFIKRNLNGTAQRKLYRAFNGHQFEVDTASNPDS